MQQTRDRLLVAGLELFSAEGLDAPSLDAICARAGYTRGAFYVHFQDRDDFLVAVMERAGESFLDAVLGGGEGEEDLSTTVQRFVAAVASGSYPLTKKGGVKPRQLLDACARSPKIRARYVALVTESLARLARVVQAGQRRQLVREDIAPDDVAVLLLTAVIGAQTLIELKVPLDLARAAGAVLALLAPSPRAV
jgi:TetR/AcrR family transcriptional regulator, transcriptional repressor for nem operon